MDVTTRIETALELALERVEIQKSPPKLAAAIRYAVFPGGARIRPRLCLAVARACGDDKPLIADAAAVAIEMMHCASLVHDDLPCFDDADRRRGKPSVHKAYGEAEAVLVGDGLIVMAFETLARTALIVPARCAGLVSILARASGAPHGIVAGQAWECEANISVSEYHRAKTGALFAAATMSGAQAAGTQPDGWRILGERIGEAFQVADDIQDMMSDPQTAGKPCGQDDAHNRPSALRELGVEGAVSRLKALLAEAVESIPDCPGSSELRGIIHAESKRFMPKGSGRQAA
jgi:geranylgeranyl diphosphate synthase, type II